MVFLKYKREKIEEIVRVLVEREEYVGVGVGWLERERIERESERIEEVYMYYKCGKGIGKGVKGKRSVRSMRISIGLSKDPSKEHSKEVSKEVSKDPSKDPSKEVSKDPSKDHSKEHTKEHPKEV